MSFNEALRDIGRSVGKGFFGTMFIYAWKDDEEDNSQSYMSLADIEEFDEKLKSKDPDAIDMNENEVSLHQQLSEQAAKRKRKQIGQTKSRRHSGRESKQNKPIQMFVNESYEKDEKQEEKTTTITKSISKSSKDDR